MRSHKITGWLIVLAITLGNAAPATDNAWTRAAIDKVAAHRSTPRSAQLRGAKGTVEMQVKVDRGGMITDYRMIRSSGVPILDLEADLIMLRVGSFTAPPDRAPTQMVVPIRW